MRKSSVFSKQVLFHILVMAIGINIMTFGVAAFYASCFGSDTGSVFCDGLHVLLNISRGSALYIYNGTLIFTILIFRRKLLRPAMFLHYFLSGSLVDFYSALLARLGSAASIMGVRVFLLICGILSVCVGIGLFISPGYGGGVYESFLMLLQEVFHGKYSTLRWISDSILTLAGWLMGGTIGFGTILCVLCIPKGVELTVAFVRPRITVSKQPTNHNIL